MFNGTGCYDTSGIVITEPVTINGGTYNDPATIGMNDVKPIIRIKDTTDVSVENVVLNGLNTKGGYHPDLVGEEGINVLSSTNVSLSNVRTNNTFGDGLIFGFQPRHAPSADILVSGYTVTKAGRQGITLAYVTGAVFNAVDIVSTADTGWDFESDGHGIGSGNITVNGASGRGVHMIEALSGPVTYNDSAISGDIAVVSEAATSGQPVTFNGGSILQHNRFSGIPPAGIWVKGPGNLIFVGVTIGRMPHTWRSTGPAWCVIDGGHLLLLKSPALDPQGTHDAKSTVTILA